MVSFGRFWSPVFHLLLKTKCFLALFRKNTFDSPVSFPFLLAFLLARTPLPSVIMIARRKECQIVLPRFPREPRIPNSSLAIASPSL